MQQVFQQLAQRLGPAPRTFKFMERFFTNNMTLPQSLIQSGSMLSVIFQEQKRIFAEGKLGLAAIVQANKAVYENNDFSNAPAVVVHSQDPYYQANPEELQNIAESLYALKESDEQPTDEETVTIQTAIRDENSCTFNAPVAKSMTGGRDVYFTTVIIWRSHLPNNKLEQKLLPVFSAPGQLNGTIIVPSKYWPSKDAF